MVLSAMPSKPYPLGGADPVLRTVLPACRDGRTRARMGIAEVAAPLKRGSPKRWPTMPIDDDGGMAGSGFLAGVGFVSRRTAAASGVSFACNGGACGGGWFRHSVALRRRAAEVIT